MPEGPVTCDVVIPARNEAENLPALVEALRPLRDAGVIRNVVLCDNGSTDDTARLAENAGFVVVREHRPGYGGACLAGLHRVSGFGCRVSERKSAESAPSNSTRLNSTSAKDVPEHTGRELQACSPETRDPTPDTRPPVAFLDADLADDPAELRRLLEPIAAGEADLVLGRRVPQQAGALDPHQRFGNRLACFLIWLTTGRRYRDLGPMRVVTWAALDVLEMRDRTWGWTVEMQFKAATRGLRTVELDVPYRRRRAGVSKISGSLKGSVKAGVVIIRTIAALWWRERKRKHMRG